jgi:hypothetical protein
MGYQFFALDIMIALSIPLFVFYHYRRGRFSRAIWYMYWVGVAIGMIWEIGFYLVGPEFSDNPAYLMLTELPFPLIILPLIHTLWDGGLFLVGVWLIYLLLKPPHLTRFRWSELGVMVLWGQSSELAVELIAVGTKSWVYTKQWWNPVLFKFTGLSITLVPQLVWLVAPIVFYVLVIQINKELKIKTTSL